MNIPEGVEIILGSGSPRRQSLLEQMNIQHRVELRSIEEKYDLRLQAEQITDYLAQQKGKAFHAQIQEHHLIERNGCFFIYKCHNANDTSFQHNSATRHATTRNYMGTGGERGLARDARMERRRPVQPAGCLRPHTRAANASGQRMRQDGYD